MTDFTETEKDETHYTIAFYNLENLFDLDDDAFTNDNDFLKTSVKKWTHKRFQNKLRKLGYAISNIGKTETEKHPAIIGVCEVENTSALNHLMTSKHLANIPYDFVHYDSPDERGIDVALIYDTTVFKVRTSETFSIHLVDERGEPDYTRDILLVSGLLNGESMHFIVNHWSSRREGQKESENKRLASSQKVGEVINTLRQHDAHAKIIVMGDFNDDPSNTSIKNLVENYNLFNPMATLRSYSRGTSKYNKQWNLFDQILFTTNFFEVEENTLQYGEANIFDEDFLKSFTGKFKGTPFRTYVGKRYKGGYSDHFPVYMTLKK